MAYNSFGIDAFAESLVHIRQPEQLAPFHPGMPFRILGGGTNVLITSDLRGAVLRMEIDGIEVLQDNAQGVLVRAGAGQAWHGLVEWAIGRDLGGIENLSLIPGTVGAAPVQNIGAYGAELSEVFAWAEVWDLETGRTRQVKGEEAGLGYRDSHFKGMWKGRYVITHVVLRLQRHHRPNISYAVVREALEKRGITDPSIREVSNAIVEIRKAKLPDPACLGNAGSFFKNCSVDARRYSELKLRFPEMPAFAQQDGSFKIPSGWLIESCGWKGLSRGQVACYEKQALVLVNIGGATGQEILAFANEISQSVFNHFGLKLEPEVNIWGDSQI
ncbi:MAG: UDP-N-acetylenolpyruvoylglucosamine reductase [Saprospiraceae bacterium]|jgi:UDP-N-acetylmuramate dehydrogenase|nr:UDP-N-acetylenolpyruvoylglucosamine reductase [Saprospiraceae bacterium]